MEYLTVTNTEHVSHFASVGYNTNNNIFRNSTVWWDATFNQKSIRVLETPVGKLKHMNNVFEYFFRMKDTSTLLIKSP